MTIKKGFLFALILGLAFTTFIVGCGGDEENDKSDVDESLIIGSWEIESVNGSTFQEAFSRDVEAQEGLEQKLELVANDWNSDIQIVVMKLVNAGNNQTELKECQ